MLLIIFLIVMLIRVVKLFFGVDFYGSIFGVPFLFISTHVGLSQMTLESAKLILPSDHPRPFRPKALRGLIGIKKCNVLFVYRLSNK